MTSSVRDLSDKNDANEQQKQSQPEVQQQSQSNANFQPGMAAPSAEYRIPHNHLEAGHLVVPTAYPVIDPSYGGIMAVYGGHPMIHPHMPVIPHPVVPLPTDAVEEPIYVNAKQYHGIIRRRQSRAKAESENKLIKFRKPYLHESRHMHALKRARGDGGRFLAAKADEDQEKEAPSQLETQPCGAAPTSRNRFLENQQDEVNSHSSQEGLIPKDKTQEGDMPNADTQIAVNTTSQ